MKLMHINVNFYCYSIACVVLFLSFVPSFRVVCIDRYKCGECSLFLCSVFSVIRWLWCAFCPVLFGIMWSNWSSYGLQMQVKINVLVALVVRCNWRFFEIVSCWDIVSSFLFFLIHRITYHFHINFETFLYFFRSANSRQIYCQSK